MLLAVSLQFWSDLDQLRTSLPPNYTLCEEISPGAMKDYDDILDGQKWIPSGMHQSVPEDCDSGFLKSLSSQPPTLLKETAQLQLKQFLKLYRKLEKVHQAMLRPQPPDTKVWEFLEERYQRTLPLLKCEFSKMVDFLERDVTPCAIECIKGGSRETLMAHRRAFNNIIQVASIYHPGRPFAKYSLRPLCGSKVPVYWDDDDVVVDQSTSAATALITNVTELLTQSTVENVTDLLTTEEGEILSSTLSMLKENITTAFNNWTSVLINSTTESTTHQSNSFNVTRALLNNSILHEDSELQQEDSISSFLMSPLGWSVMAAAAASVVFGIMCTTWIHFKSARQREARRREQVSLDFLLEPLRKPDTDTSVPPHRHRLEPRSSVGGPSSVGGSPHGDSFL